MINSLLILAESAPLRKKFPETEHLNMVQLLGLLEKDPEILTHHQGKMARFYLLTTESFVQSNGELTHNQQRHLLTALGSWAEMASSSLHQGQLIYAEGRLVHNSFTDKLGVKRILSEVKVRVIKIIS
ncbi:MAG TPA: single-stranded DNA-binding protein [Bacteroidia bacterium]|jgi:single stranded DNA-binding protein|nr:single-stranded DNA-binding protein [Bacteroidia bacterium]